MILSETETATTYPAQPTDLSDAAAALDTDALWQRIEAWVAYRWTERQVVWIVEGPGTWAPRLKPASVDTFEVWQDDAWEAVTLDAAPLGYELECETYRFTATVGTTETPPAAVQEAYRRLAEYLADTSQLGRVASSGSKSLSDLQVRATRPAAWQARALHYSGAADLLRPWRH